MNWGRGWDNLIDMRRVRVEKVEFGLIELEEGVRMIGNVFEIANEDLQEGMPVVVTFEDVEDGVSLPQWRPAR